MLQLRTPVFVATAVTLAVLATAGCHVSSKGADGKEDVDIRTPLGGLAVKTDPAAVLGKIGLPAYPGATPVKERGDDKGSADVDMSFGSFHMRVLALGFQTGDDRAKVEAFYRKALQQYSDVILCQGEHSVGQPATTGQGLTCKGDRHIHPELRDDANAKSDAQELTLKAGSAQRQHLVAMQTQGSGTHFSLVALDLPGNTDSKER